MLNINLIKSYCWGVKKRAIYSLALQRIYNPLRILLEILKRKNPTFTLSYCNLAKFGAIFISPPSFFIRIFIYAYIIYRFTILFYYKFIFQDFLSLAHILCVNGISYSIWIMCAYSCSSYIFRQRYAIFTTVLFHILYIYSR